MLKRVLTNAFNKASRDDGKDCLINYVWINKEPDKDDRNVSCSVSLKHLDCAYENADKYPKARVKIWIDFRFLDARSRKTLQDHYERFAPDNVELCDLNNIETYRNDEIFTPGTSKNLWIRVDLARLIVLDHVLKTEPEQHAFYADFDVRDVEIRKAKALMNTYGLALGTTGAKKTVLGWLFSNQAGLLENGYFAFKKGRSGSEFLQTLLSGTFEVATANEVATADCNGYFRFRDTVREWATQHHIGPERKLAVPNVLYSMRYQIPDRPRYKALNWN